MGVEIAIALAVAATAVSLGAGATSIATFYKTKTKEKVEKNSNNMVNIEREHRKVHTASKDEVFYKETIEVAGNEKFASDSQSEETETGRQNSVANKMGKAAGAIGLLSPFPFTALASGASSAGNFLTSKKNEKKESNQVGENQKSEDDVVIAELPESNDKSSDLNPNISSAHANSADNLSEKNNTQIEHKNQKNNGDIVIVELPDSGDESSGSNQNISSAHANSADNLSETISTRKKHKKESNFEAKRKEFHKNEAILTAEASKTEDKRKVTFSNDSESITDGANHQRTRSDDHAHYHKKKSKTTNEVDHQRTSSLDHDYHHKKKSKIDDHKHHHKNKSKTTNVKDVNQDESKQIYPIHSKVIMPDDKLEKDLPLAGDINDNNGNIEMTYY